MSKHNLANTPIASHREYGTVDRESLGSSPVLDVGKNSPERLAKRTVWNRWQLSLDGDSEHEVRQRRVKRAIHNAEEERAARIEQLNYYAELRAKKDEFEVIRNVKPLPM